MSDTQQEFNDAALTQEEMQSALFAQMVMQLSSTALVMLGRAPNPVTSKTETDLEAAQLFIGQLDMLEAKTKGNLTPDEQQLLKQSLMTVRMAFVQAVETGGKPAAAPEQPPGEGETPASSPEEEGRKRFTKSYGAP